MVGGSRRILVTAACTAAAAVAVGLGVLTYPRTGPDSRVAAPDGTTSGSEHGSGRGGLERLRQAPPPGGRLVVLGLDALDWRLVDELTGRGLMPHLARLLRDSAQARVRVRPPLLSPLVWTSIATGVPPEVHGVLDFVEPDPATGAPRPVSSAGRRAVALWEIAAAAGRTTAVIGWWATFPAKAPPRGRVYSDRLSEQLLGLGSDVAGAADPAEAREVARRLVVTTGQITPELLAPVLAATPAELSDLPQGPAAWSSPVAGLGRVMAATLTVERLTEHELDRGTDVVLAYLEGTDTIGHLFGQYRPPRLPTADPEKAERFAAVVDRYHVHVDGFIGRVLDRLAPQDTLVIVSDHGFAWGDDRPAVASGVHTATAAHWHRPEAVLVVAGPSVRPTTERGRMELLDVTPCLLALAGLPPGAEMPGRPPDWLTAVRESAEQPPIRYAGLVEIERAQGRSLPGPVADEEMARLRALGYLAGDGTAPADGGTGQRVEARRLHNLGVRLADSGSLAEAEQAFRDSLALAPDHPPTHMALAQLLRIEGRYTESDAALWRAVDLGLGDPSSALVRVARDYRRRGLGERAGAILEEAARRFPGSATVWLNLGAQLGELGDLPGALRCLERATALDPDDPVAHRNLAAARLALGDREGALRSLRTASRLDPDNPELHRQLAALGGSR